MALDETQDAMAGEYVLGTLDSAERLEAQSLLTQSREFAAAVDHWNERLTPLLLAIPAVPAQPQLRERILAGIGTPASLDNVVSLKRRVTFWRSVSLAV